MKYLADINKTLAHGAVAANVFFSPAASRSYSTIIHEPQYTQANEDCRYRSLMPRDDKLKNEY